MNRTVGWIIVVLVAALVLAVLVVIPARRSAGPEPTGVLRLTTLPSPASPEPTPPPPPSPTADVLTPDQEKLTDLQAETEAVAPDPDIEKDLGSLEAELRGIE